MEFVGWIVFIGWWVLGGFTLWYMDRKNFKRFNLTKLKRKPKALAVPVMTLAEAHAEAHAHWEAEARAILQANCEHIYHHQSWYTCRCCGLEEKWEFKEGCSCRYETIKTLAGREWKAVTYRSANCTHHGTDYTYWPLSERKQGPYGYQNDRSSTVTCNQDQELQRKLNKRRINFDVFTVSSK